MEQKSEISEEKVMDEILNDPMISGLVKQALTEYTKIQDVHSSLNVTFIEALRVVWQDTRCV